MAIKRPFYVPRVDALVPDNANLEVKTSTTIVCWSFIFLTIGACIYAGLTWPTNAKLMVIFGVYAFIQLACDLAALYGIRTVRPVFLIPMMLFFAFALVFAAFSTLVVLFFCMLNFVNYYFYDHLLVSFNHQGTLTHLFLIFVLVLICCALLCNVYLCYDFLCAEKKAANTLPSDENGEVRDYQSVETGEVHDYHSIETGVKLITISEL